MPYEYIYEMIEPSLTLLPLSFQILQTITFILYRIQKKNYILSCLLCWIVSTMKCINKFGLRFEGICQEPVYLSRSSETVSPTFFPTLLRIVNPLCLQGIYATVSHQDDGYVKHRDHPRPPLSLSRNIRINFPDKISCGSFLTVK